MQGIGTIFAAALNHTSQASAWDAAFHQAPYQQPPKTPVWFIKPRNTIAAPLSLIPYPDEEETVLSGATLAIVIGKTAKRVAVENAGEFIAGYRLANEISLPENSFYRPAIKAKCRDGFCPLGEEVKSIDASGVTIITEINGEVVQQWNTAELVRSASELVSAISDFITLQPGDHILLGTPHQRVAIKGGDRIVVRVDGFSPLENQLAQPGERG